MPLARLKLEPRQYLVGDVRLVHPRVLIGERQLPKHGDRDSGHYKAGDEAGSNRRRILNEPAGETAARQLGD